MNLSSILRKEKQILVEVDENRKEFLKLAKESGFKWFNGENIDERIQICSYHMYITDKKEIGNISTQNYIKEKNIKKIKFKNLSKCTN